MRGRGSVVGIVVAVVVVLVLVAIGQPDQRTNREFDPASTGPLGSRAVVVLLEELGADVRLTGGDLGDADTALLLVDRLDEDATEAVEDWVEDGGVLVVADERSSLFRRGAEGGCPVALEGVEVLDLGAGGGELERGGGCFDRRITSETRGLGTVISIRDRQIFINLLLGEGDNAVVPAALLAPTGTERVGFVVGSAGGGDQALTDLLGSRAAQGIGQVVVAAALYALWRARRLGRAVVEPQPVAIAGSELVAAVGRLQEGRRRPDEVADTVRRDLLVAIERRLGVPAGGDPAVVAEAVAGRCGMDPARVLGAIAHRPVTTDDQLLDVLADLDRIRAAVLAPLVQRTPGGS